MAENFQTLPGYCPYEDKTHKNFDGISLVLAQNITIVDEAPRS
jgi:hypothetical protein